MALSFVDTIAQFIGRHELLSPERLQLVALSGGADSVCLLLVLRQLGYRVEAVHCNFKLRGAESDRDEAFVKSFCQKQNVILHITHFDTRTYASLHRVSIEMAARQLRYAYFAQLRRDLDAETVCVAHHSDDAAETVLLNLIRGTGLKGLTGIKPRNGHVVRPLLCVSRQQIVQWLDAQRQDYVTDSSNLVPDVVRNKLRLQVIPLLRQVSPAATESLLSTARHLGEAVRVYDAALRPQLSRMEADGSASIAHLLQQPSAECLLYEWLAPKGFSSACIEDIGRRLPTVHAGRQWHSATHTLTVSRGRLLLDARQADRPTLRLPMAGTYVYDGAERFRLALRQGRVVERQPQFCCLDAHLVQFPLVVRPVQTGDRFQPFGMRGTKLVSDYLTDVKMPLPQRRRQLVIADASGRIVWLVDQRPDGRFCVSTETHNTLEISHTT